MCGSCCCPNVRSNRLKPSAWLCDVRVDDEIGGDRSSNKQMFLVKLYDRLRTALAEDDIQSSITIEKHYKQKYQRSKEVEKEQDVDEDD